MTRVRCNASTPLTSFNPSASSTFSVSTHRVRIPWTFQDSLTLQSITAYSLNQPTPTPLLSTSLAVEVPKVQFQCLPNTTIFPNNAPFIGIAALSNATSALPALIAARLTQVARQFAYCFPSLYTTSMSGGSSPIIFGRIFGSSSNGYTFQNFPNSPVIINASALPRVPLIPGLAGGRYAITVLDISVGGNSLRLAKPTHFIISTAQPYTKLERSLYLQLRAAFRRSIGYGVPNGNITSPVAPVAPFDTCFNATNIGAMSSKYFDLASLGRIDMQLTADIKWSFFPFSLVMPEPDIMCLAVVNAGLGKASVLGAFQQQGRFVHFDLERSTLGFTIVEQFQYPWPLTRMTYCGNFIGA